jgi:hypothetical protein
VAAPHEKARFDYSNRAFLQATSASHFGKPLRQAISASHFRESHRFSASLFRAQAGAIVELRHPRYGISRQGTCY